MPGAPVLALTPGEPAGIGPDLVAALAGRELPARLVVIADRSLIERRAALLGLASGLPDYEPAAPAPISLLHLPLAVPETPGRLDARNAPYVLATLRAALAGWREGRFAGLVTGPVHKGVINNAGVPFTGHTEFLADETGTPRVVMMLAGGGMRVALATTHLPLREVAAAITEESLSGTLDILLADLKGRFGCARPRVLVAGLNPHAGEGGHLGDEEIRIITPVLDRYRAAGHLLEGPLPADTLFHPERLRQCDAVLAMYHDQGLPVLKHASFGEGVNVTLGLPLVRTSVDHGTALDLAGKGSADPGSLMAAIELAARLAA